MQWLDGMNRIMTEIHKKKLERATREIQDRVILPKNSDKEI